MAKVYHRNTRDEQCDTGVGYMMFAADQYSVEHYGKIHWTYDGAGAIDADELIEAAIEAGFEEAFYEAGLLNPRRIVDTAGAWDDVDAIAWVWDNVCEPRGWTAIITNDGAILFDATLATRAN